MLKKSFFNIKIIKLGKVPTHSTGNSFPAREFQELGSTGQDRLLYWQWLHSWKFSQFVKYTTCERFLMKQSTPMHC